MNPGDYSKKKIKPPSISWSTWTPSLSMTPDDLYNQGYQDAKAGKAMNASHMSDPNYIMGYEDGAGDKALNQPTSNEYVLANDPPKGFNFTKMKRVPDPYEYYLSKAGNPTYLTRPRKNSQQRHILSCANCGSTHVGRVTVSGMALGCRCHPMIKGRD